MGYFVENAVQSYYAKADCKVKKGKILISNLLENKENVHLLSHGQSSLDIAKFLSSDHRNFF